MNILVLSFYFQPDLSAGSFRTTALVNELKNVIPDGSEIDVVTTLPNRYHSYFVDVPQEEKESNLTVKRVNLPSHECGMIDQSRAFGNYFRNVVKYTESRNYDIVFATSSRLMTAVLGAWVARKKKALLYLDIRDIFVDTINDVLPKCCMLLTKPIFSLLERWAVNRASKVNLVSKGFADYFADRYPGKSLSFFTNGIDDEFIEAASSFSTKSPAAGGTATVLYAGNLGEGQGLHAIIPQLAKKMTGRANFRIIGDGGRKNALCSGIKRHAVDNVTVIPPVNRDQLTKEYQDADILFLHLNDYEAFKKVLPSKIFEYAAMGKPIWAGVSGYSAEFISSEINNSAIFHPCNAEQAEQAFTKLSLEHTPRAEFINKYARRKIMKEMVEDILSIGNRNETA